MTEKEVVTVIINEVQLHWVTAACSASPCRVSTPSNRRHIHFTGAVVPFQAPITADHCLPLLLQTTLAKHLYHFGSGCFRHGVFAGEMLESDALAHPPDSCTSASAFS